MRGRGFWLSFLISHFSFLFSRFYARKFTQDARLMGPLKTCSGLVAASLVAWLLLMPPFSVTPNGKTYVDTGAPIYNWETFSSHPSDTDCRKHRDKLREELEKAAASNKEEVKKGSNKKVDKSQVAFATLRERADAARCVSSSDIRLRTPSASPAAR
jgi:hypothetical protein